MSHAATVGQWGSHAAAPPASSAIGALSRIDAGALAAALRLPRQARVHDLGIEIHDRIPHNPAFARFSLAFTHTPEGTGANSPFQYAVEVIVGALHVGTHIDALVHVQAEGRIYGGDFVREARGDCGWKKHGMETVLPILGLGLVLDVAGLHGVDRLPDSYEITRADLEAALRAADQSVRMGDIVVVRTGKIRQFHDPEAFQAAEPGVGRAAAVWLYDRGMAVLATDTTGTEPLPFADPALMTHRAMLVDRGVHLIENLFLEDLAQAGIREGLFVALPLKITGATGSWVRPVLVS